MKINICDVCLKENVIVKARFRIGFQRLKLDVCVKHEHKFSSMNYEDFSKEASTLLTLNLPMGVLKK